MLEALANPPAPSYQSVKLPAALVSAAKESAQTFRRSIAGQIEYWAALGKNMESQGLTTLQAKQAMEQGDKHTLGQSLIQQFKAHSSSGRLTQGIEQIVQENKQKAAPQRNV